jgi:hypothetical protein
MTGLALAPDRMRLKVRHYSTQQVADLECPARWTVHETTEELVRAIELPRVDARNVPTHWELFLRRADGTTERLRPSSTLGESVREDDELQVLPEVVPGRGAA